MLFIASTLFTGACLLVAAYVILTARARQRLATVKGEVAEELAAMARKAERLDGALVKALLEPKNPATEVIGRWQAARAEILPGKPGQGWAWSEDDLRTWSKEQVEGRTEEVKRGAFVAAALATITAILLTGGVCLIYFYHFARSQAAVLPVPAAELPAPPQLSPTAEPIQ